MFRFTCQIPALRRLRRILSLAVPVALAACEGSTDSLAPEVTSDPAPELAGPTPDLLGTLASNRIAFAVNTSAGGTDMWTMDPQGGTPAHVTTYNDIAFDPNWSFDHKRIAFTRLRGIYKDVYLVNADGTNPRWARSATYPGAIVDPSWSPDGTHLLVSIVIQNEPYLAKLDLATENLALIAPAGVFAVAGTSPVYDATGKTIYFVAKGDKTVKRFTPGGSVNTVFTSSTYLSGLSLSPDGTRLAYSATVKDMNSEVYVLNLATKVSRRLTWNEAVDHSPTWSPDGTRLAFASYRTGKMQIWTMNSSTGGSLTRITSRAYGASAPSWAR